MDWLADLLTECRQTAYKQYKRNHQWNACLLHLKYPPLVSINDKRLKNTPSSFINFIE